MTCGVTLDSQMYKHDCMAFWRSGVKQNKTNKQTTKTNQKTKNRHKKIKEKPTKQKHIEMTVVVPTLEVIPPSLFSYFFLYFSWWSEFGLYVLFSYFLYLFVYNIYCFRLFREFSLYFVYAPGGNSDARQTSRRDGDKPSDGRPSAKHAPDCEHA